MVCRDEAGTNDAGSPLAHCACPAPQNGDSGWPLWPPGMCDDAVGFMPGRDDHAFRGAEFRALHARHHAVAGERVGGHAEDALAEQRNRVGERMADGGGVAFAPGAFVQRAFRCEFVADFDGGVLEQGVPAVGVAALRGIGGGFRCTGVAARQQVRWALFDQRPDDAFKLREVGHDEVVAQRGLGGGGQAVTMRACTARRQARTMR